MTDPLTLKRVCFHPSACPTPPTYFEPRRSGGSITQTCSVPFPPPRENGIQAAALREHPYASHLSRFAVFPSIRPPVSAAAPAVTLISKTKGERSEMAETRVWTTVFVSVSSCRWPLQTRGGGDATSVPDPPEVRAARPNSQCLGFAAM